MIEDEQVIFEQVKLPADEQDEGMKGAETDDNNNYEEEDKEEKKAVKIEFIELKADPENDIYFRW